MIIAALYDIHANLPALEAVLDDISRASPDHIIIGGDVLPGPMPRRTLARLLELDIPATFIRGDGDREVLARLKGHETPWFATAKEEWRAPVRWTAEQLDESHRDILESWPATHQHPHPELGEILFCHATPQSDTRIFTRNTPERTLAPIVESARANLMICGHTHMPFDRTIAGARVINAGSVGMPFGRTGASWLLLDQKPQLQHTDYDLHTAARLIETTDYPDAHTFAYKNILSAPAEDEMLAIYDKAAAT